MTDAIKFGKKAFTWSVVAMTILWSVGISALVPTAAHGVSDCNYSAGDLIQIAGDDTRAVYLLNDNLERMAFPNSHVYHTWYEDFSGVNVVTPECGETFGAAGSMVNYRPGSWLVRFGVFPKLYFIGTDNVKHWITSEAVAMALFGDTWNKRVAFVGSFFEGNYVSGSDLTEAVLQDGMLIRVEGSDDIYFVMDGERHMVDGSLLSASAGDVRTVSAAVAGSVPMSGSSVTPATVVEDPSQGGAVSPSTPSTPVAAGSLSVALAANTPASAYALKNTTRVAFTNVVLSAGNDPVTVKSMKVERVGSPASDGAFTGINIVLEDGSLLASTFKGLNSDHEATFTEDVVVPANTSVTLMIVGKMADSNTYGGEVPKLALSSVETDASVSGSLPLVGNAMTINTTVAVGSLTVAESPALGTTNEEVGTEDVEFVHVKLSNSSSNANIDIERLRFYNAGSASDADVANMELVVDGAVVATADMDGRYVNFDLSGCSVCEIADGKNETFSFRGDLVGGSARTLDFDFKVVDDIVAYDMLNSAYIVASGTTNYGNIVTIGAGKLTVSKTNDVLAQNVADDADGAELASWNFKVEGEAITIKQLVVRLAVTGTGNAADLTNLRLVDVDGNSLTGNVDGNLAGESATSTDSFTLPIGDNVLTLIGDLNSDFATNDTIAASIDFRTAGHLDAQGETTGDSIDLGASPVEASPQALITANTQTVKALSMSITTLSNPAANTIAAGTSQHLYAQVRFDAADAGEDIKVTAFDFEIEANSSALPNSIQNITFKVGDKTLGITKNGSSSVASADEEVSVSLSTADQFTVPKGGSVTMMIYADLSAGATEGGTHQLYIGSAGDANTVTAQGELSGNTATTNVDAAESNAFTVGGAGGSMQVSLDASNPSAALHAAGTEATLAAWNFYATSTENVELDYIYVQQIGSSSVTSSYTDYDEIWFEDADGNEIAGTRMNPTSTSGIHKIDFADDAFIVDIADSDGQTLFLKARLNLIGNGQNGTAGDQVGFFIYQSSDVVAKGNLTGSGTNEFFAGTSPTAVNAQTHYLYKAYPSIKKVNLANSLVNTSNDLYKFTVTAVNGEINIYKMTFDIATSTATVTDGSLNIYDTTDNDKQLLNTSGSTAGTVFETAGSAWTTNYPGQFVRISTLEPHVFVLRGSVTGAASGSSVSAKMAGDAAVMNNVGATNMAAASTVDGATHDDFIWSDRSAGAHTVSSLDWTNGFLVDGLPATLSEVEGTSF